MEDYEKEKEEERKKKKEEEERMEGCMDIGGGKDGKRGGEEGMR